MKATITLTLDPKAADVWLATLYDGAETDDPPPSAAEHFREHLLGFVEDEMNFALWPDFKDSDHDGPAILTHVKLTVGGATLYDEDWSFREDEGRPA